MKLSSSRVISLECVKASATMTDVFTMQIVICLKFTTGGECQTADEPIKSLIGCASAECTFGPSRRQTAHE